MMKVELKLERDGSGPVIVNGAELREGVRGVTVVDRAGKVPVVTIEMRPVDGGIVVGVADVRMRIGDKMYRLVPLEEEEDAP